MAEMRKTHPVPAPRLPGGAFTPPDMGQMATNNFVGQVRKLVEILVATDHKANAEQIRDQAMAVLDDPKLKSAVNDAEERVRKAPVPAHSAASPTPGHFTSRLTQIVKPASVLTKTNPPGPSASAELWAPPGFDGKSGPDKPIPHEGGIDPTTGLPVTPGGTTVIAPAAGLPSGSDDTLRKVLDEARELTGKHQYEEALQRYLWYFNHSRNDAGEKGVRISFALSDWIELGRRYPKARQALIEIRDGDAREFSEGRGYFELFMEVSSINELLGEEEATYALFKSVGRQDKQLAQECYGFMEPQLAQRGEYDLCMSYIGDPQAKFGSICQGRERMKIMRDQQQVRWRQQVERMQEMAKTTNSVFPNGQVPFPPVLAKMADNGFIAQTRNLIEILVATGHKSDAEKIRDQAVAVLDVARLKSAVGDAENKIRK